jgi:hypothetical protein
MRPSPAGRLASLTLLSLVSFVLAHEATFLLTFGDRANEALVRTGHGALWSDTVRAILTVAALASLLALGRMVLLVRRAPRYPDPSVRSSLPARHQCVRALTLWTVILTLSICLLVGEENLECALSGQAIPGWGVLGDAEHVLALPVFALVSLIVAVLASLYRWRRDVLIARILRRALPPLSRSASRQRRSVEPALAMACIAGRHLAVRGPPLGSLPEPMAAS